MLGFFKIKPRLIACDTHPLYRTAEFAKEYASDIELLPVQHHHAHIASVMAEHGLAGPVIGVAFDGTGYGDNGTIWGGEILLCEGAGFDRFSHLRDISMIGGDSSMRDGWKSAVCRAADHALSRTDESALLREHKRDGEHKGDGSFCVDKTQREPSPSCCPVFDIDISYDMKYAEENNTLREYEAERKTIEAAVARSVNTVRTSSMGRLFDAVASLLGICHVNRYEGECAVMLENAADRALRSPGVADALDTADAHGEHKKNRPLCVGPLCVVTPGVADALDVADALALRFHLDVARAILGECRKARRERGTDTVCLSGGVFQNKILMEKTARLLRAEGFTPYYNISVSPNDGGIALGQAYVAMRNADNSLKNASPR
jgi:hydrogenase maturation protein HypF